MCRLGGETGSDPEQQDEQTGVSNHHEQSGQRKRYTDIYPGGGWIKSPAGPAPAWVAAGTGVCSSVMTATWGSH